VHKNEKEVARLRFILEINRTRDRAIRERKIIGRPSFGANRCAACSAA
jgi:hypothetical protein